MSESAPNAGEWATCEVPNTAWADQIVQVMGRLGIEPLPEGADEPYLLFTCHEGRYDLGAALMALLDRIRCAQPGGRMSTDRTPVPWSAEVIYLEGDLVVDDEILFPVHADLSSPHTEFGGVFRVRHDLRSGLLNPRYAVVDLPDGAGWERVATIAEEIIA